MEEEAGTYHQLRQSPRDRPSIIIEDHALEFLSALSKGGSGSLEGISRAALFNLGIDQAARRYENKTATRTKRRRSVLCQAPITPTGAVAIDDPTATPLISSRACCIAPEQVKSAFLHRTWKEFRSGSFTIIPSTSETGGCLIEYWDTFMLVLLFATAFYVPFWVCIVPLKYEFAWLRCIDLLCDVAFAFDIVLQFVVAFPVHHESIHNQVLGHWCTDPVGIAHRYVMSWFAADLASVFPVQSLMESFTMWDSNVADQLVFQKLLRLTHMVRMIRLTRSVRLLDRWNTSFGISYSSAQMCAVVGIALYTCHWFACALVYVSGYAREVDDYRDGQVHDHHVTWLHTLIDDVKGKGDPCTPDVFQSPHCVYMIALYWASLTLTGVGYGDITPQNQTEYVFVTFMMMISGFVWAYVLGALVNLLSNTDPHGIRFRQNMDDLNELMSRRDLPHDLRIRMRVFLHESKHIHRMQGQNALLESLVSEGLQQEMSSLYLQSRIFKNVYWAQDLQQEVHCHLLRLLTPCFFGPNEQILLPECMVLFRTGIVTTRGVVLREGDVWGVETILLVSLVLTRDTYPRTLTCVEAQRLTREQLQSIMKMFPHAACVIRRAQVRAAVRRGFVWAAKMEKETGNWLEHSNQLGICTDEDGQIVSMKFGKGKEPAAYRVVGASRTPKQSAEVSTALPYDQDNVEICQLQRQMEEVLAKMSTMAAAIQSQDDKLASLHTPRLSYLRGVIEDSFGGDETQLQHALMEHRGKEETAIIAHCKRHGIQAEPMLQTLHSLPEKP
eukprot:TRINITY_DN13798_c0_g1_i1.p1 TRINITY_DN13798_c0_g1~~TRINITY_DN13798_c0_g1_i1.p1  ORF type:complete len:801 (+),score=93.14 TRINITY_DN13798_c0_g1_i1:55-2403(+)